MQKERRKLKASALIDNLKHMSSGMLRFFSDEKIFIQDVKPNRWLSAFPEQVPIVMHSKYPIHIMVLGISSDRDIETNGRPYIFQQDSGYEPSGYESQLS